MFCLASKGKLHGTRFRHFVHANSWPEWSFVVCSSCTTHDIRVPFVTRVTEDIISFPSEGKKQCSRDRSFLHFKLYWLSLYAHSLSCSFSKRVFKLRIKLRLTWVEAEQFEDLVLLSNSSKSRVLYSLDMSPKMQSLRDQFLSKRLLMKNFECLESKWDWNSKLLIDFVAETPAFLHPMSWSLNPLIFNSHPILSASRESCPGIAL